MAEKVKDLINLSRGNPVVTDKELHKKVKTIVANEISALRRAHAKVITGDEMTDAERRAIGVYNFVVKKRCEMYPNAVIKKELAELYGIAETTAELYVKQAINEFGKLDHTDKKAEKAIAAEGFAALAMENGKKAEFYAAEGDLKMAAKYDTLRLQCLEYAAKARGVFDAEPEEKPAPKMPRIVLNAKSAKVDEIEPEAE